MRAALFLWVGRASYAYPPKRRGALTWAVGGQLGQSVENPNVASALLDQAAQGIATEATALRAINPQHVELADKVSERGAWRARGERAIAGHQ